METGRTRLNQAGRAMRRCMAGWPGPPDFQRSFALMRIAET
jgi:hypothetical protein